MLQGIGSAEFSQADLEGLTVRLKALEMRYLGLILSALICGCLLFLSLLAPVLADKGIIPIASISVYEPGQKAIIAWDGEYEILILSTDVYADSDTMALEVFPLPSQPESVEKGDFNSFVTIGELIYKHFPYRGHWMDCGVGQEEERGVDIVFHEKIGAHDISVVKATDASEFIAWAEDFLAQSEIEHEISSPKLESVVGDYIEEGMNFFVFDLIEVGSSPESVEPIVYRFKTDFLYYPLKISSIIPGSTWMGLFLLTPKPLDLDRLSESLPDVIEVAQANGKRIQCELNEEELQSIDPRLVELFGEHAWLTALESYDYPASIALASLDEDVKITQASLKEAPGGSTAVWVWVIVGVLGGILVFIVGKLIYINTGTRRKKVPKPFTNV